MKIQHITRESDIPKLLIQLLDDNKGLEGDTGFTFDELVQTIKASDLNDRFEYERKDDYYWMCSYNLDAKQIKYKHKANRYSIPTFYYYCPLRIMSYEPSKRSNGKKTSLYISGHIGKVYYRTIQQLMQSLRQWFPLIDEWEEKLAKEEAECIRLKRIQDLFASSSSDLLKELFKDTGLLYYYSVGRDFLEINVKSPRQQVYVFNIKFSKVEKEFPQFIEDVNQLSALVKKFDGLWIRNVNEDERNKNWLSSQ